MMMAKQLNYWNSSHCDHFVVHSSLSLSHLVDLISILF